MARTRAIGATTAARAAGARPYLASPVLQYNTLLGRSWVNIRRLLGALLMKPSYIDQ